MHNCSLKTVLLMLLLLPFCFHHFLGKETHFYLVIQKTNLRETK